MGQAGCGCLTCRYAKFHAAGSSAPHTPQTNQPSLTTFRSPQAGHLRNTTSVVNRPGCRTPMRSRAAATAGHDSGSGQKPVDWLLTSTTSTPSS